MQRPEKAYKTILLTAFLAVLSVSCGKEDIYLSKYSRVQEGVSTKQDVMMMYGRPRFVLPHRDGSEQWSYEADASGSFSDKHHNFDFYFDKNGVVINKSKFTSKWP
jgi:hypothetical protein|uniref:Lipoprotein SmpA/OmlA domain-containing protein n=1 Tax=Desulfobacca acetoxidans TaxID=60893 RepID=A0A7C3WRZ8_9BACT